MYRRDMDSVDLHIICSRRAIIIIFFSFYFYEYVAKSF